MEVTFFTYIGVIVVCWWFVYPVMDFVDWGKRPKRKR